MEFNVDGQVKSIVTRAFVADTPFENMPENTEMLFEDYIAGHKKDLLRKRYKITEAEYNAWSALADRINDNTMNRMRLNAEQQDKYDDWDMTRCVNTLDIMTTKEAAFLEELLA